MAEDSSSNDTSLTQQFSHLNITVEDQSNVTNSGVNEVLGELANWQPFNNTQENSNGQHQLTSVSNESSENVHSMDDAGSNQNSRTAERNRPQDTPLVRPSLATQLFRLLFAADLRGPDLFNGSQQLNECETDFYANELRSSGFIVVTFHRMYRSTNTRARGSRRIRRIGQRSRRTSIRNPGSSRRAS
ncbi:hypothetical protein TKK_0009650 [Trichogramma kaykai]